MKWKKHLEMVHQNYDHIMYVSWDRCNLWSFWAIFCIFTPLLTPKIKTWKNVKKSWRYYPFTNLYHKWRSYDVWFLRYKAQQTVFFCHFGPFFCPFTPKQPRKNQNFEKMKEMPRYIILPGFSIWGVQSHMHASAHV